MNPKTEKTTVSLPGHIYAFAQARADAEHKGNFSAYVQDLIRQDMDAGRPERKSPKVLAELTRWLLGELDAELVAGAVGDRDQRIELRWLLRTYVAFIANPHGDHAAARKRAFDDYVTELLREADRRSSTKEESSQGAKG